MRWCDNARQRPEAAIEPGRVLVGPAGVFLTQRCRRQAVSGREAFIVLDAGMTELMRPALYNAFHRIEPLIRRDGAERRSTSWDRFARALTPTRAIASSRRLTSAM